ALGVNAVAVYAALDFDTAAGKIVDRSIVQNVSVDRRGAVALQRFDDVGAVFEAAPSRDLPVAAQHGLDLLVVLAPPPRPVVGVKAALAEVAGPRVFIDQLGALTEVGHVLRKVAARLGDERAEVLHDLKADRVLLIDIRITSALPQEW